MTSLRHCLGVAHRQMMTSLPRGCPYTNADFSIAMTWEAIPTSERLKNHSLSRRTQRVDCELSAFLGTHVYAADHKNRAQGSKDVTSFDEARSRHRETALCHITLKWQPLHHQLRIRNRAKHGFILVIVVIKTSFNNILILHLKCSKFYFNYQDWFCLDRCTPTIQSCHYMIYRIQIILSIWIWSYVK